MPIVSLAVARPPDPRPRRRRLQMGIPTPGISPTVERVTGRDQRGADVLTIGVANAHPSVMGPLAVELAFYRTAIEVVDHPAPGVAARPRSEFGCIDPVQAHRCSGDDDGVGVPDLHLRDGW